MAATNRAIADASMRPLFVLSLWRSGSSLLHALLNQHPQIALLYEGELPQLQPLLRGHFHDGSWRQKWEFWNQALSRHGIPLESLPSRVGDAWQATSAAYREFARRKNATVWGEKSPHWYDNALRTAAKFPDARFIFLWRDVNAIMESIERAARFERFFRKPGFLTRVLVGTEKLRQACGALRARGHSVHEVHYEELIANTEGCMRQICGFLELGFEPEMTTLEKADRSATFSGRHHELVRSDQVVSVTGRASSLSPPTRTKLARYVWRWKKGSGSEWPKLPSTLPPATRPPDLLELALDRALYRTLVSWDLMVKVIYSIAPIALANAFRRWVREHWRA